MQSGINFDFLEGFTVITLSALNVVETGKLAIICSILKSHRFNIILAATISSLTFAMLYRMIFIEKTYEPIG